jgi:hypothetical protein
VLRRLLSTTSSLDVALTGYLTMFQPDKVGVGSIMQGDASVAILQDELDIEPAWTGLPRARDQMVIDGRIWTVIGSSPVYDGETLLGHTLHCRGG